MANDNKVVNVIPVLATGDSSHNLSVPVTIQGGAGSGGTSSSFGAAYPVAGTAAGFKDNGGNMAAGLLDASGYLKVNVAAGGAGGGAVTVADGADVTQGSSSDVAVVSDASGTVNAKLRGIVKIFADIWDSANHWFQVKVMNGTLGAPLRIDPTGTTTQPVSGTVTVNAGTNLNTSTLAIESGGNLATLAGTVSSAKLQNNVAQWAGVAAAAGTGNIGTGTPRVVQGTGSSINTGQISVGASSTLILAANTSRIAITVINNGTTNVFIGLTGVATTTGHLLVGIAGYPMKIRSSAAIYGIAASGSQSVSYLEEVQ